MKILKLIILLLMISGCTTNRTLISGTWKNPQGVGNYNNILVAALTSHAVPKSVIETDLVNEFKKNGVEATESIMKFPINEAKSDTQRYELMKKVEEQGMDAILTISLLEKETDSRYIHSSYSYDPFAYPFYRNFWGYYSYWYPYAFSPGYYVTDKTYYLETNLYDISTEELVWSAQSRTYNPVDLNSFSREFAEIIVSRMKEDNVVNHQVVIK